jgi:hypothetical protein
MTTPNRRVNGPWVDRPLKLVVSQRKPLPQAKPWICRLFFHLDPTYTREEDGQASWSCGTETCRRKWQRLGNTK